MSDRTSADIFGNIFEILAEDPEKCSGVALRISLLMGCYDFDPREMCCDDALVALGIDLNEEYI